MQSEYNNKALLTTLYEKYKNGRLIAEAIGVNKSLVYKWLKKYEITNRPICCRHTVDIDYFKEINTPVKAYWLGFLMADGCIYKGSSKNSYILQINLKASDIDILQNFNKAIKSTYPIREHILKQNNKEYSVATLAISNTEFCSYLMTHGIVVRKSLACKMPELEPNLIRHFIRGYFDGDGCITKPKNKSWSFSIIGGKDILSHFQSYFRDNDITSQIYEINHSKAFSLETQKLESIANIYCLLYSETKTFLKRKKEVFNNAYQAYLSRLAVMQGQ